ncbi:MAG: hypothetical protein B6D39_00505 [Anaerolineae bacterium UTCFX2]|jgi:glycosyltransferase involved in cell wall biosynthesis|nr:glycosyltransferase family 4 protein [Anaerolineales bacterium]OQY94946.1 MAG: hypothetical protein B6D39_00505 [Anaerolineae bacterium UTCFX2]
MRLLFVADGRSPIALNWIQHFLKTGDEVHLVSTFACAPEPGFASYHFVPVAFSALKRADGAGSQPAALGTTVRLRTQVRQWLGPFTLGSAARRLKQIVAQIQPDLVHALRIPYEGMLAAAALRGLQPPLLISVWGNDFTLHAPSTPLMRYNTRRALQRADALHADCQRDVRLARGWGFAAQKPAIVLPGAGGVQSEVFYPNPSAVRAPVIINPRGFRAYVNNAAFFRAIPKVLAAQPAARFLCPAMLEQPQARQWAAELGVASSVELLPRQQRSQMAQLFRQARIVVSPSNHDGTPNTLLEALACGCLPVAGDLESIREWITPEENGLLVDPNDPQALAQAMLRAIVDDELVERARRINAELILRRAEHKTVMQEAEVFYRTLLETALNPPE